MAPDLDGTFSLARELYYEILEDSPEQILEDIRALREEAIFDAAIPEITDRVAKAKHASSSKTAINEATQALVKIAEARRLSSSPITELDELESEIREFVRTTQLESYLEAARKAEFKGQIKKAIDQYQEALYFLKTDDIPDNEQASHMTDIEKKLTELMNPADLT